MNADTELQLHDLALRYCQAHDAQDALAVSECFARDAEYLGSGRGRDAIRGIFERLYATRMVRRRHVLTNFRITSETGKAASLTAIELLFAIRDNQAELILTGRYLIDAVLEDGTWKIQRLEPRMDMPYQEDDMPQLTYQYVDNGNGDGYYVLVPAS